MVNWISNFMVIKNLDLVNLCLKQFFLHNSWFSIFFLQIKLLFSTFCAKYNILPISLSLQLFETAQQKFWFWIFSERTFNFGQIIQFLQLVWNLFSVYLIITNNWLWFSFRLPHPYNAWYCHLLCRATLVLEIYELVCSFFQL